MGRWVQSGEYNSGDAPSWNSKKTANRMLKQDDGQKDRGEERRLLVTRAAAARRGWSRQMRVLLDFWQIFVLYLCVYACTREGKEEGREVKNDGEALSNRLPGFYSCNMSSARVSGPSTHGFDPSCL